MTRSDSPTPYVAFRYITKPRRNSGRRRITPTLGRCAFRSKAPSGTRKFRKAWPEGPEWRNPAFRLSRQTQGVSTTRPQCGRFAQNDSFFSRTVHRVFSSLFKPCLRREPCLRRARSTNALMRHALSRRAKPATLPLARAQRALHLLPIRAPGTFHDPQAWLRPQG